METTISFSFCQPTILPGTAGKTTISLIIKIQKFSNKRCLSILFFLSFSSTSFVVHAAKKKTHIIHHHNHQIKKNHEQQLVWNLVPLSLLARFLTLSQNHPRWTTRPSNRCSLNNTFRLKCPYCPMEQCPSDAKLIYF